jgi:hypothetical protein
MNENEMDNRGSKSKFVTQPDFVKEQRVDGNWSIAKNKHMLLRYTLMDFERNYQIKILSKQLNIKNFSTIISSLPVNAWFITGLIDAEGSFSVVIDKNKSTFG